MHFFSLTARGAAEEKVYDYEAFQTFIEQKKTNSSPKLGF